MYARSSPRNYMHRACLYFLFIISTRISFLTFLAEIKHGRDATVSHYCHVRYSFPCRSGLRIYPLVIAPSGGPRFLVLLASGPETFDEPDVFPVELVNRTVIGEPIQQGRGQGGNERMHVIPLSHRR